MIRYCAGPAFASENLRWNGQWLIYRLPKPCHTGKRFITLDPIDFIDKIATLISPARRYRHHYHGAFASNSPFRSSIWIDRQRLVKASKSNQPEFRFGKYIVNLPKIHVLAAR